MKVWDLVGDKEVPPLWNASALNVEPLE